MTSNEDFKATSLAFTLRDRENTERLIREREEDRQRRNAKRRLQRQQKAAAAKLEQVQ